MRSLSYLFLSVLPWLSGCASKRSPEFLLFGSYFPSWLVGVAVAIPFTLLLRVLFIRLGFDKGMPARLLVYTSLMVILAMIFAYVFSPR